MTHIGVSVHACFAFQLKVFCYSLHRHISSKICTWRDTAKFARHCIWSWHAPCAHVLRKKNTALNCVCIELGLLSSKGHHHCTPDMSIRAQIFSVCHRRSTTNGTSVVLGNDNSRAPWIYDAISGTPIFSPRSCRLEIQFTHFSQNSPPLRHL